MREKGKPNIQNMIHILMQLDEESLLLIDSGAKLLAARQKLENKNQKNKRTEQQEMTVCHQLDMKEYML